MKKKLLFGLLAVLLLGYVLLTATEIWRYGALDEKRKCDAAIVLGAATADGQVSPVYQERLNHGIWLYHNGYADRLIVTGGTGDGNAVSDAFAAKQYVISQGVPSDVILLEDSSTITQENIENAKRIMDAHDLQTALIVSDPLHMKRAMLIAKDYGIEAYSSPTPTTRYISLKTQIPFLIREEFFYIGYKVYRVFR